MAKPVPVRVSEEEYLRQERARENGRAELLDSEIVMMAGAPRRHNQIVSSIDVALNTRFGNGICEAVVNDMRVKAEESEAYT